MKKILCLLLVLVAVFLCFASCGNQSLGFGNFTFEHIHLIKLVLRI